MVRMVDIDRLRGFLDAIGMLAEQAGFEGEEIVAFLSAAIFAMTKQDQALREKALTTISGGDPEAIWGGQ